MYDSLKPVVLVGPLANSFLASFMLGWGVTTGAGLASYPLDTIRRRMMMTSGEKVHYNGLFLVSRHSNGSEWFDRHDGRWSPDRRRRGCRIPLQGRRSQHPSWCCRCRCPVVRSAFSHFAGRRSEFRAASTIWPRASSPTRPARVSYGLVSSLPRQLHVTASGGVVQ
jgi:hypothetical protein